MKHHIIKKLSLGLVIIVGIVGGFVYWEWPETGDDGVARPTSTLDIAPKATTYALDVIMQATTSTLSAIASTTAWPSPAEAAPTISWMPASLTDGVATGQSKTVSISFVASQAIKNIEVLVVPALQRVIRVTPSSLANVAQGQTVSLTVTISASKRSPVGTLQGTIQLRSDGALAKPFPVTLSVCACITANGISLEYSPDWEVNGRLLSVGGPINLNNFGSVYGSGGIIPRGGAEISVTATPLQGTTLDTEMNRDAIDSTVRARTSSAVAGGAATRIEYLIPLGPAFAYSNVIVYFVREATLYKVSLLYRVADPRESEFLTSLEQVLSTLIISE